MFWKKKQVPVPAPPPVLLPPVQDLVIGRHFFAEERQGDVCIPGSSPLFEIYRSKYIASNSPDSGCVFTAWTRDQAEEIIGHLDEVVDREQKDAK